MPLQSPGHSPILCTKSSIWLLNPKISATADYCHFSTTLLQRLSKPPSCSPYLSFWLQTQLRVLEQGDTSTHALCFLLTWTPILHFAVCLRSLPKETYEGTTWPKRLLEGFLHHWGAPTCCYYTTAQQDLPLSMICSICHTNFWITNFRFNPVFRSIMVKAETSEGLAVEYECYGEGIPAKNYSGSNTIRILRYWPNPMELERAYLRFSYSSSIRGNFLNFWTP